MAGVVLRRYEHGLRQHNHKLDSRGQDQRRAGAPFDACDSLRGFNNFAAMYEKRREMAATIALCARRRLGSASIRMLRLPC